jgi:acyl phosphate:glycerol-3-phosphate acyltransferase
MSPFILSLIALVISYLLGSIPFGWVVVKIATGRDIRGIESGRTGGTNAMRAAGFLAGLFTAAGDVGKGFATSLVVRALVPADYSLFVWVQVAAPLLAVLGHNYSIFLIERHSNGKLHLRGGAGGAPCLGGAVGLWPSSAIIILPIGILVFVLIGYASLTTISIALSAIAIFAYLHFVQGFPWQYILYGFASLLALIWALRPNLERLALGTERMVGLRALIHKRRLEIETK